MHADICDPDDEAAVARFRDVLRRLGAQLEIKEWLIGVDLYIMNIDGEQLSVFSDAWSIDIEGPEDLVQRVLREYANSPAQS